MVPALSDLETNEFQRVAISTDAGTKRLVTMHFRPTTEQKRAPVALFTFNEQKRAPLALFTSNDNVFETRMTDPLTRPSR